MRHLFLLLLISAVVSGQGVDFSLAQTDAAEKSQLSLGHGLQSTSDKINHQYTHVFFRKHRRDMLWPYSDEAQTARDYGLGAHHVRGKNQQNSYAGLIFRLMGAKKISEYQYLEVGLSWHQLEIENMEKRQQQLFGDISFFNLVNERLSLIASISENYIYNNLLQSTNIEQAVSVKVLTLQILSRPLERLRTPCRAQYSDYSDINTKGFLECSALYGMGLTNPWVWVGIGGEVFSFSRKSSLYWSPSYFYSYGIRGEAAYSFTNSWALKAGFSESLFREDDFTEARGYYTDIKISWGNRESVLLEVGSSYQQNQQLSSKWISDSVYLNAYGSF